MRRSWTNHAARQLFQVPHSLAPVTVAVAWCPEPSESSKPPVDTKLAVSRGLTDSNSHHVLCSYCAENKGVW